MEEDEVLVDLEGKLVGLQLGVEVKRAEQLQEFEAEQAEHQ